MLEALLKPGPIDPSVLAAYSAPGAKQARAAEEADQRARDWPSLCRYREDNIRVAKGERPTAVFIGDSITEFWQHLECSPLSGDIVGRGVSGQTSPQILLRFYQDVIALNPRVVHILAGANDIAGNTGPSRPQDFKNNIMSMVMLAQASHIRVILGSIPPTKLYYWSPKAAPIGTIVALNLWLRTYAEDSGATFVDYHQALAAPDGAMRSDFSNEGVHPNAAGYAVMTPMAKAALAAAL
jgi:lysophospholipase L1-like esterase